MEIFPSDCRRRTCAAWLLLLVACGGFPGVTQADDASKAVLINELFEVRHSETLIQQSRQQLLAVQRAQFEKLEPFKSNKAAADELFERYSQLLTDQLTWEKLRPLVAKLYADNFTEEELSAWITFYKTPAGQAMLTKLPKVLADTLVVSQQVVAGLTPDIRRIVRDVSAKYPTPRSNTLRDWPDLSHLQQ